MAAESGSHFGEFRKNSNPIPVEAHGGIGRTIETSALTPPASSVVNASVSKPSAFRDSSNPSKVQVALGWVAFLGFIGLSIGLGVVFFGPWGAFLGIAGAGIGLLLVQGIINL